MKLLLHYLSRYKGLVFLALLLAVTDQLFINLNPYIFGNFIVDPFANKVAYFRQHGLGSVYFRGIVTGVLMIAGGSTIAWIAKGFQIYTSNVIIRRFGADLYADVQRHTLQLPYVDFEDERSGEILSLLQKARLDIETFITKFMNVLFAGVVALAIVIVIAFRLSPLLPVVYVVAAILLTTVTGYLSRKVKSIQKDILTDTGSLMGSATESLRNMELVKSLGLVGQEIRRLSDTHFRILKNELIKIKKIRSISFFYGAFVQTINQGIMFLLLAFLFYDSLSVGQLVMMQIYFYLVFGTLGDFNNAVISFHEVSASLDSLHTLLRKPVEYRPSRPEKIGPLASLSFDNVLFQYRSATRPALEYISFEAQLGETVAFAGPSGSGKTTLVKLLTGLYPPVEGNICYNGHGHSNIDFDDLRRQIGLVTQEAHLFSGSIRENMLFAYPEATDEMILEALRQASCQQLLSAARNGIETRIGEGGLKLSGGERQRLAIARSLLRRSRLLIFDEATSSLDSLTEREITDTIRQITRRQSYITILIAHRLSTLLFADRIYVMEGGRIVETGAHTELLECKGLYYAMWRQQTGEMGNKNPATPILPIL
jgi:ATP-binding cassette subfamily B protein